MLLSVRVLLAPFLVAVIFARLSLCDLHNQVYGEEGVDIPGQSNGYTKTLVGTQLAGCQSIELNDSDRHISRSYKPLPEATYSPKPEYERARNFGSGGKYQHHPTRTVPERIERRKTNGIRFPSRVISEKIMKAEREKDDAQERYRHDVKAKLKAANARNSSILYEVKANTSDGASGSSHTPDKHSLPQTEFQRRRSKVGHNIISKMITEPAREELLRFPQNSENFQVSIDQKSKESLHTTAPGDDTLHTAVAAITPELPARTTDSTVPELHTFMEPQINNTSYPQSEDSDYANTLSNKKTPPTEIAVNEVSGDHPKIPQEQHGVIHPSTDYNTSEDVYVNQKQLDYDTSEDAHVNQKQPDYNTSEDAYVNQKQPDYNTSEDVSSTNPPADHEIIGDVYPNSDRNVNAYAQRRAYVDDDEAQTSWRSKLLTETSKKSHERWLEHSKQTGTRLPPPPSYYHNPKTDKSYRKYPPTPIHKIPTRGKVHPPISHFPVKHNNRDNNDPFQPHLETYPPS